MLENLGIPWTSGSQQYSADIQIEKPQKACKKIHFSWHMNTLRQCFKYFITFSFIEILLLVDIFWRKGLVNFMDLYSSHRKIPNWDLNSPPSRPLFYHSFADNLIGEKIFIAMALYIFWISNIFYSHQTFQGYLYSIAHRLKGLVFWLLPCYSWWQIYIFY